MTEKVKLTREQADLLEREKEAGFEKHETVKRFLSIHGVHGRDFHLDELIKALYIGYEVEKTFEVGDWLYVKSNGIFIQIDDESQVKGINKIRNHYRHATPEEIAKEKQRRWWAKHGREVWELREGDILYYDDEFHEVESVEDIGDVLLSTNKVYIDVNYIKSKYYVTCFAEDRKDI